MKSYMFPGQGSQFKGMGGAIFNQLPELLNTADDILGYSVKDLCLIDKDKRLGLTQYTQPALYVVNALTYLTKRNSESFRFFAGHSLGEYNALFAAEVFDFATGLRLVKKRGELMSQAKNGGMAAVIGVDSGKIKSVLEDAGENRLDIANFNSPSQTVISGPQEVLVAVEKLFDKQGTRYIILPVSAAFHSRYMAKYSQAFAEYLTGFEFNNPVVPVISNVTARPYVNAKEVGQFLAKQIQSPVRWTESMQYMLAQGEKSPEEIGPGDVLTKLFVAVKKESSAEKIAQIAAQIEGEKAGPKLIKEPQAEYTIEKEGPNSQGVRSIDWRKKRSQTSGIQALRQLDKIQPIVDVSPGQAGNARKEISHVSTPVPTADSHLTVAIQSEENFKKAPITVSPLRSSGMNGKGEQADFTGVSLGSDALKKEYGVKYAYFVGGMHKGISSKEMIVRLSQAGILGFYGATGSTLEKIENDLLYIRESLVAGETFGVNMRSQLHAPGFDEILIPLLLKISVPVIEVSGYTRVTAALVQYRFRSSRKSAHQWLVPNKVVVKASRLDVIELFMSPAPRTLVDQLLSSGKLTEEEAEIARTYPMCDDVCVEIESPWSTDPASVMTLVPSILLIRDLFKKSSSTGKHIRVGVAGGIGSPEAVASCFLMGADFILTGSLNQCSVEADTSDAVKDILQVAKVEDIGYAPSEDLFEMGGKHLVLKRGMAFSHRASKLYDKYRQYDSLGQLGEEFLGELEKNYFNRDLNDVYLGLTLPDEIEIQPDHLNAKQTMARVFKSYLERGDDLAIRGNPSEKSNFRVVTSPAIGVFNQYVKGSDLEDWRCRHVDAIAIRLMNDGASTLKRQLQRYFKEAQ